MSRNHEREPRRAFAPLEVSLGDSSCQVDDVRRILSCQPDDSFTFASQTFDDLPVKSFKMTVRPIDSLQSSGRVYNPAFRAKVHLDEKVDPDHFIGEMNSLSDDESFGSGDMSIRSLGVRGLYHVADAQGSDFLIYAQKKNNRLVVDIGNHLTISRASRDIQPFSVLPSSHNKQVSIDVLQSFLKAFLGVVNVANNVASLDLRENSDEVAPLNKIEINTGFNISKVIAFDEFGDKLSLGEEDQGRLIDAKTHRILRTIARNYREFARDSSEPLENFDQAHDRFVLLTAHDEDLAQQAVDMFARTIEAPICVIDIEELLNDVPENPEETIDWQAKFDQAIMTQLPVDYPMGQERPHYVVMIQGLSAVRLLNGEDQDHFSQVLHSFKRRENNIFCFAIQDVEQPARLSNKKGTIFGLEIKQDPMSREELFNWAVAYVGKLIIEKIVPSDNLGQMKGAIDEVLDQLVGVDEQVVSVDDVRSGIDFRLL